MKNWKLLRSVFLLLAVFLVRPCLAKTDDSVSQQWLQWSTEKLTNDLGYSVTAPISNEIVASETGKYFASVFVEGHRGQYGDYISPTIDNINIVHVGSAKAPYSVETWWPNTTRRMPTTS